MAGPRTFWNILKGTTANWLADQASSIAAALAFYCAFSLAPLLIIIVTIAGWIVGDELAYSYLDIQVTLLFGRQSAELILSAMQSAQSEEGVWATLLSVLMLLVGASTVFAALESALQQIWGGSLVRGAAAVVVLLGADLPVRRRVHGLSRPVAAPAAPGVDQPCV